MAEQNSETREPMEQHTSTLALEHDDGLSPLSATGGVSSAQNGSPRTSEQEYNEDLQDENVSLRRRLAENEYSFQRRLEKQTELISKLQGQLKDSQRRMAGMEAADRSAAMAASTSFTSPLSPPLAGSTPLKHRGLGAGDGLEDGMFSRFMEEQEKNTVLYDVNTTLRQELEEMRSANFHLTSDLLRVTHLYDNTRQVLTRQSEVYKKTETSYVSHLATEHRQMLNLWRSLQQLRREFSDTRSMATRNMSSLGAEIQRAMKSAAGACQRLSLQSAYAASVRAIEKAGLSQDQQQQHTTASNIEQLVWENLRQLVENQSQKEEELRNLQMKFEEMVQEKRSVESTVLERDRQIDNLKKALSESTAEQNEHFLDYLHNALRDAVESSLHDTVVPGGDAGISPRRRARSYSPRSLRGQAGAENTVRLVRDAFDRHRREIKELSARLRLANQRLAEATTKPSVGEIDRNRLEQDLKDAASRTLTLQRERDDALAQKEKLRSQLAQVHGDKLASEKKLREIYEDQISTLNTRLEGFHKRILELESVELRMGDEKERVDQELERLKSDATKLRGLLDSSHSAAAEARDQVNNLKSTVIRLERDNRELSAQNVTLKDKASNEAARNEELTAELDRLALSEKSANERLIANQRDIQTLSKDKQTLVMDLQQLQRRFEQAEIDRSDLRSKKEVLEAEIRRLQEQVVVLQEDKSELKKEKTNMANHLEHRNAELRELESQLSGIRTEFAEADAQLKPAIQKQQDLESLLEACRRELASERHSRSTVQEERRQLVQEKTEVEQRITTFMEQIHRLETSGRQFQEKTESQVLEYERRLQEMETQRKSAETHIAELSRSLEDISDEKRAAESRANSLQSILVSQEELIRTKENERRLLNGRVGHLESQLRSRDTQLKQLTDKFESVNTDWEKTQSEMAKLKGELEGSHEERRRNGAEISRLTSEVHHVRIQLNDVASNAEAMEERLKTSVEHLKAEEQRSRRLQIELDDCRSTLTQQMDCETGLRSQLESVQALLSEHSASGQTLQEQLFSIQRQLKTAEQEKRMLEERLRDTRDQLAKSRKDLKERSDAANVHESRATDLESRFFEMDSRLKTLQKMLDISQETEADLKRQLEQTATQKESMHERILDMQRKCHELETERKELTALRIKLEREKTTLKHELVSCQNDRRRKDNLIQMAETERAALDKAVSAIEKENAELHRNVTQMQAQVAKMEQAHSERVSDLAQRHQQELDKEISRLRLDKDEASRQVELLEKMYKQKVKSLEDQVARLKEQLRQEGRRRQEFFSKAIQQSQDVAQLRAGLNHSFSSLRSDPMLDSLLVPSTGQHDQRYSLSPSRLTMESRSRLATSVEESMPSPKK